MAQTDISLALLGATGYTGLEALRLVHAHPQLRLTALATHQRAADALTHAMPLYADLPPLQRLADMDWTQYDAVLSALPHGAAAPIVASIPSSVKIVDLSADFRLKDADSYAQWYGQAHAAPDLLDEAVYGLSEHYRDAIAKARLVACPGCYPTAALLLLWPLLRDGLIAHDGLVIDAKSGVSGAGRKVAEDRLFCEISEGAQAYSVGAHRHIPEIEQALFGLVQQKVEVSFTPHLLPMNRGEIVTIYARLTDGQTADDVHGALQMAYTHAPFVQTLPMGEIPSTRQIRGTNHCLLASFADRVPGRVVLISVLDNLVKGSSGQAIQNLNLMFGLAEETGLAHAPVFP